MRQLTNEGKQKVEQIANRYGVSVGAVMALLEAVANGGGTMAQFNHPELGGSGQWMQGGMTMVGDMFNYSLKSQVDGICNELSTLLLNQPFQVETQSQSQVSMFSPSGGSGNWWPIELGMPNSSGAQNNIRYAYFANINRLAIEVNNQVTVYDTLDHSIGGFSQQQGGGSSLTFTSQYGTVLVNNLPIVSGTGPQTTQEPSYSEPPPPQQQPMQNTNPPTSQEEEDIFAKIEKLSDLKSKGAITEQEFNSKKSDLLNRL